MVVIYKKDVINEKKGENEKEERKLIGYFVSEFP
jgi:hypothetical protein